MALNAGQKAERVLKLLISFRTDRIASAMSAYGFTNQDLEEGWMLLRSTGRVRLDRAGGSIIDTSLLTELDAWENRWFPLAKATLERRHPAVAAQIFKNLSQQEGAAVTVSVGTFLERYDAMVAGTGTYGAEGAAAKGVLAQRGLNDAEIEKARTMLTKLGTIETSKVVAEDPEAFKKAEEALWGWYLEWSQVARTAITQKPLLRAMGFGPARRSKSGGEEEGEEEEEPVPGPVVEPKPVPTPV